MSFGYRDKFRSTQDDTVKQDLTDHDPAPEALPPLPAAVDQADTVDLAEDGGEYL